MRSDERNRLAEDMTRRVADWVHREGAVPGASTSPSTVITAPDGDYVVSTTILVHKLLVSQLREGE